MAALAAGPLDAAAPYCEDICGPETPCKTACRSGGGTITCGQYGDCKTVQPCPTVECAGGCAERPRFTVTNTSPAIGEMVTFTADTSNINPATANWDLGDGTHILSVVVSHAYDAAGAYKACLKANETICDTVQTACKWINVPPGGGGGGGGCFDAPDVPCLDAPIMALGRRGALRLPEGCRPAAGDGPSGGTIVCGATRVMYSFTDDACRAAETVNLPSGHAVACVVGRGNDAEWAVRLAEHDLVFRGRAADPKATLLLWQLAASFLPVE